LPNWVRLGDVSRPSGILQTRPDTALRGAKVTLYHFVAGGMAVHYKDRVLPVTAYGTYPVPATAEDEKTIDARVDAILASAWSTNTTQPQLGV
jgi:hypothetical protein